MRAVRNVIPYRQNRLPYEMLRGTRVFDSRTGFVTYTSRATQSKGGYVDIRLGPRFDPRQNALEP